ncbi:hypothetical protein SBV1_1530049 [Verrucomicrobia bacterium]|nr:hypothetical protein SBV1_1530049 [Verrucomicrobiota bacterium]
MFGFLKHFRRKPEEAPASGDESSSPQAAPITGASLVSPAATHRRPGSPKPTAGQLQHGSLQNGRGLELPLQGIIQDLPLELQPRVRCANVGELTITVALEKVLSQLARGSVKISFGELRQAAPQVFSAETDRDRVMVPLPLGEIISRLNPALITRRRVQKQVEVPEEISSPFDPQGRGLIFSVGPAKPEPVPQPTAAPPPSWAANPPAVAGRNSLNFAPTPPAPAATPQRGTPMVSASRALRELSIRPAVASPPVAPSVPAPPPAPPAPAQVAAPAPPLAPPAPPAPVVEPLILGLASGAESWPEPVRRELVELNLVDAKLALPLDAVEQSLRQGRIAYPWKVIRSWVRPPVLPSASPNDGVVLELPLKIVAPLFLARQREAVKAKPKVSVDAEIPNLFFGFPQPEAPTPTAGTVAGKPVDTNYYVWEESSDTVHLREQQARQGPTPGTRFVAKYATPNEIVSRAAALEGVAGALIALPDGLMVAGSGGRPDCPP